ncbi:MAG: short chain dehydrogenase [Bacteroidetes bacterium]|nr:MAG: short chain dehydrogenase [Bacteroidota bacterium]
MRIIIVGATGTIGRKITAELSQRHEVIPASAKNSSLKVDITSHSSIEEMFKAASPFDALVSCTGSAYFGPFESMTEENFYQGIRNKLMGQVNLVMIGKNYINEKGSFTLTSGILADDPVKDSVGLSMVNGALNSFVKAASLQMPKSLRINIVSSGVVEDSAEKYARSFPGHNPQPMSKVVNAYVKSVEGIINGEIIRLY